MTGLSDEDRRELQRLNAQLNQIVFGGRCGRPLSKRQELKRAHRAELRRKIWGDTPGT